MMRGRGFAGAVLFFISCVSEFVLTLTRRVSTFLAIVSYSRLSGLLSAPPRVPPHRLLILRVS